MAEAFTGDALELDAVVGDRAFDEVFIDAPCSGLGTLRRHPEIRWRIKPADIVEFARVQLGMLQAAAPHVAPGGALAYATCTVTREENNGVVKALPRKRGRRGLQAGTRQRPLLRGHAPRPRLPGCSLRRPLRAHRVGAAVLATLRARGMRPGPFFFMYEDK